MWKFVFILTTYFGVYDKGINPFIGEEGIDNCESQGGSDIVTIDDCRSACNMLGKTIEKLKNNKRCYIAGNGKCRQSGIPGRTAFMVCSKTGNTRLQLKRIMGLDFTYACTSII